MRLLQIIFLLFGFSLILFTPVMGIEPDDAPLPVALEDRWDAILHDHVRPGMTGDVRLNVVDYTAIKEDVRWTVLLDELANAMEPSDSKGKIAFWANAYNIMAIKVVLSEYPVESIKDVGGVFSRVWNIDAGIVAGKVRSLGGIEHDLLRKLGDARVHSAIVCASVSCPPLRREAYRADRLDEQLDDQMRTWLANPKVGASVEDGGKTLRVSYIFKLFTEDFERDAGSLRGFLDRYLPEDLKARAQPNAKIRYLDYDWSLNDARRSRPVSPGK